MNQKKLRGLILITVILFIVFWAVIFSATHIDAVTSVTPILYATNWSYLPYVSGFVQGPTATATTPPPTMTPWATNTVTPSATATATSTPSPTASNTPTPTATNTASPGVPAPKLYDIENNDQDGNYTIAWSEVEGAYYQVMENLNDTGFTEIYRGTELSIERTGMPLGTHCYNVRARANDQWSDWAGEKCTTVLGEPEPEYACEFETLYEGPRSMGSDVEMLHDGRVFITQTSENSASIFDPETRSFKHISLPQGGGDHAAVLADGTVLMTVEGDDPHSMIYDPIEDDTVRLDSIINCLGVYDIFPFGDRGLITYCGDNHGYIYTGVQDGYGEDYWVDIEFGDPRAFVHFERQYLGGFYFDITNGITANVIDYAYSYIDVFESYDYREVVDLPVELNSAESIDKSTVYIIGGFRYEDLYSTVKEAYAASREGVNRIADMWQDRQRPEVIGLQNGSIMVLAGHAGDFYYGYPEYLRDIEIYIPSENKWYRAGSLNIERAFGHKAVELLNGEVFVYGGYTDPGPGYSFTAPPEIGRCEQVIKN